MPAHNAMFLWLVLRGKSRNGGVLFGALLSLWCDSSERVTTHGHALGASSLMFLSQSHCCCCRKGCLGSYEHGLVCV